MYGNIDSELFSEQYMYLLLGYRYHGDVGEINEPVARRDIS